MTNFTRDAHNRQIVIGVDTHKYVHVAVATANREGYARLEAWAASLGRVSAFGIEGTGSYGVGLASFLRRTGHRIVEVNRGDRRSRRDNGKRTPSTPKLLPGRCSAVRRAPRRKPPMGPSR